MQTVRPSPSWFSLAARSRRRRGRAVSVPGGLRPPRCRRAGERRRGSMLVVALGVLAVLSLLAVTFITIMNLEKVAAANYVEMLRARMTAESGIERMVAALQRTAQQPMFQGGRLRPFVFGVRADSGKEIDPTIPVAKVEPRTQPFFWGYTGRTHSSGSPIVANQPETVVGLDEYRVKVLDTSALLDLNYPMALEERQGGVIEPVSGQVLELMLAALGEAIARLRNLPDPVREIRFSGAGGSYTGARALLAYRASLPGMRFTSKSQLREVMPEDAYRVLRDFVTVHSWIDHKAVSAAQGDGFIASPPARLDAHHRVRVRPRPQLNLNLAPREVLIAAIAPLAGRRYAYLVRSQAQFVEEANDPNYSRPSGFDIREDTRFELREGWVYIGPIGVARAEGIANWIINNRPFRSVADFHQRLLAEMRKASGALDAFLPRPDTNEARIFPPPQGMGALGLRYDLTGVHGQEWFPRFVREAGYSLLLANFEPGFVANSTNPNSAGWLPVDKGSLLYPADLQAQNPQGVLLERQTMDACFESRGVYEITSLGQIVAADGEILAQEELLSVVRLFDMAVHRSQADFEANALAYRFPERADVTSYPETRQFFAGPTPQDDLPPQAASRAWGSLEIRPRARYDGGTPVPIEGGLGAANFGRPLFGAFFEWPLADLNPGMYLHADHAAGQPIAAPPAPAALAAGDPRVFARARGLAADYANGNPRVDPPVPPGSWFVLSESLPNNPGTGTLFNDGYYATYRTHRDRTLWYRAGAPEDRDEEQGALDPGAGRTEPPPEQQDVNVFYRKGGIEFWYKPDFDWSYGPPGAEKPTPLACGYVFASRVWYNHGRPDYYPSGAAAIQPPTPSDGTQLFVFRNTEGQLRATRLYFRVVGDPEAPSGEVPARFHDPIPNDPYGDGAWFTAGPLVHPPPSAPPGKIFGAIERYREAAERDPVDDPTKRSPPDGYVWPPAEFQVLDEGIKRARTDAFVQFDHMKHWKAHEWHHIAVYWDDGATDKERALRIYVDGVKRSVAHGLPVDIAADKHMFVRLNEPPNMNRPGQARYPKDHLFIAGVQRNLAKTGVGVFKHTNTVFNETAPGQALPSGIDPNRVTLFACGTVDDVIVYDGTTSPPDSLSLSRLRRFQPSADYVNHFDLRAAFPRSGEPLTLARLSWTALLPTRYGNALSPDGEGAVEVKVVSEPPGVLMNRPETAGTTTSVRYDDMREYSHVNLVDANGRPAQLWPPNNPAGPWPRIRYELRLHAASFPSSAGAGVLAAIDTPVVQEVALSWFLPAPEVMLKERLVD